MFCWDQVIRKFPHIGDYKAFNVPLDLDVQCLLKCQLAIATFSCKQSCSSEGFSIWIKEKGNIIGC